MNPIFNFDELNVEMLKQFDGTNNYFNCSHLNGRTIFRKEHKLSRDFHACDIVDQDGVVLLQNYADEEYHYSFEDARWIDDKNISVCVAKFDIEDLAKLEGVHFKKYNIETKKLYHYVTRKAHFEKHWQFYNNYIIYHVNPYTIMDSSEHQVFVKNINWKPWIEKYGNPGLSTNVFDVHGEKFLLYHSYVYYGPALMKYFVGVMKVKNDLTPVGYCINPLLVSDRNYSSSYVLNRLWSWRNTTHRNAIKYEVIFPMNVVTDDKSIHIYGGLNDCSAVKMSIDKSMFVERVKSQPFIIH